MIQKPLKLKIMNYFEDLLKNGYYIQIANCVWNGVSFKEYRLQKDESNEVTSIACYLNKKAFKEVEEYFNFSIVHQIQTYIECNKDFTPYGLQFETHTKEALKITFD